MAPRAYWNGFLKLSLMSCPISIYPVFSEKEKISFNMLNRESGKRLKQQYVDSESFELVQKEDRVRGYEHAKNTYVFIEDEELNGLKPESTRIINISSFVQLDEVDIRYYDKPYYVVPSDKVGHDAYAVFRECVSNGVAAIGTVVIGRREKTIMLMAYNKGIMGITLHFPYEIREAEGHFDEVPEGNLDEEIRGLASTLVKAKMVSAFDPSSIKDRYEDAVAELVKTKIAGKPVTPQADVPTPNTRPGISIKDLVKLTITDVEKKMAAMADERQKLIAQHGSVKLPTDPKPPVTKKRGKKAA